MEEEEILSPQEFNQTETLKVGQRKDYQVYKQWLKDNGVLVEPRVRYPSCFGNGKLVGVTASSAIEKGRAIVAIPYKLLITVEKVKNIEKFGKIIQGNPDVFSPKEDRPFMILLLYISYEMLEGEKSFYYPYFKIAEAPAITDWTSWDMQALNNKQLTIRIKDHNDQLQQIFVKFLRVYRRHDDVFPAELSNMQYKELFQKVHAMISTRAFGWSLPSISMIPLADSFNHGISYVDHYLVDTELEDREDRNDKAKLNGYVSRRSIANLAILKEALKPSAQELDQIRKLRPSRKYKFVQKHKQILNSIKQPLAPSDKPQQILKNQLTILHQQYKAGVRNFRQLHFYDSSCSEDNDTDEETLYQQTFQEQTLNLAERYPKQGEIITEKNKLKHVRKYWKLYTDNTFQTFESDEDEEEQSEQDQTKPKQAPSKKQKPKAEESVCSSEVSDSSLDQSDEDFGWVEKSNHDNMYLVMQTRRKVRQDQQIFNFYGRRSNQFLLLAYNFVMGAENHYDSYPLRMKSNPSAVKALNAEKLIHHGRLSSKAVFSREVRIKSNRVSATLINHCRCWLVNFTKFEAGQKLTISIPFTIQFQRKVLGLAKEIIRTVLKEYNTNVQEDEQLLEKTYQCKGSKYEAIAAIRLRLNHKRILEAQLGLINLCIQALKRWKKGRLDLEAKQMPDIKKVWDYLCQLERGRL